MFAWFHRSKKWVSVTWLVLVLTMYAFSFNALAADAPVLSVPDDLIGQPGATVQVPVNLTSSGGVAGAQFDLAFDASLLSFTGAVPAD
jgi:hypothetical protein